MSKELVVVLRDDLDRSTDGVETHQLSLDSDHFELELSSANWQALKDSLAPYLAVARPVKRRKSKPKASKAVSARASQPSGVVRPSWANEIAEYATERGYDWTSAEVRREVREWENANGFSVGKSGVIPRAVLDAHYLATIRGDT